MQEIRVFPTECSIDLQTDVGFAISGANLANAYLHISQLGSRVSLEILSQSDEYIEGVIHIDDQNYAYSAALVLGDSLTLANLVYSKSKPALPAVVTDIYNEEIGHVVPPASVNLQQGYVYQFTLSGENLNADIPFVSNSQILVQTGLPFEGKCIWSISLDPAASFNQDPYWISLDGTVVLQGLLG